MGGGQVYDAIHERPEAGKFSPAQKLPNKDKAVVEFVTIASSVKQSVGQFSVSVVRHGKMENMVAAR